MRKSNAMFEHVRDHVEVSYFDTVHSGDNWPHSSAGGALDAAVAV